MSLISLKTNLTELKFGHDRMGGASSNQPYIKKPIPIVKGALGDDFLLRGGVNAVTKSGEDVIRLTKFFFDFKSPKGILFTAKQNLLSRVAVRTQASGILNEYAYTPLSSLAQAGVVAFGGHVNKQGINPFIGVGQAYTPNRYYDVVAKEKISLDFTLLSGNRLVESFNRLIKNEQYVLKYQGGPGSVLGIGKTKIKFASDKTTKSQEKLKDNNVPGYFSYKQLSEETTSPNNRYTEHPIMDFRSKIRSIEDKYSSPESKRIEDRVYLGDPGKPTIAKSNNEYSSGPALDKITSMPLYSSPDVTNAGEKNDLVKFRIASIDINSGEKTFMHFRAFLNSISDNYSADWETQKYLGRAENFYNQTGFNRSVSLSWTVAAQSRLELIAMYKKLNYLASTLAPDYSGNGLLKGSLVQLTIGGYFYEQPGFITNLNYELGEDTPWEIGLHSVDGEDTNVKELPHIIRVNSFNFTPIHTFIPSKQINKFDGDQMGTNGATKISSFGKQRYIALRADSGHSNYD